MSDIDYQEEIRSAKAEMDKWPDWKKSSTRLEGTDKYFDQQKQTFPQVAHKKLYEEE